MKQYLSRIVPLLTAAFMAVTFLAAPLTASAQTAEDIRKGVNAGGSSSPTRVNDVVEIAINIFSIVVGIAAVIMLIVAGLKYVTSSGDSNSVNSAKNTILYAIVGLIVVALAQSLAKFVLQETR